MKEYENLATLIAKIEAQQKEEEGTPGFNIGEQLKDIARAEPASAELIDQDIEKEGMGLPDVADAFKKYADAEHKKKKDSCICITPIVAEGLIRKFYGLPKKEDALQDQPEEDPEGFLDLESFL